MHIGRSGAMRKIPENHHYIVPSNFGIRHSGHAQLQSFDSTSTPWPGDSGPLCIFWFHSLCLITFSRWARIKRLPNQN